MTRRLHLVFGGDIIALRKGDVADLLTSDARACGDWAGGGRSAAGQIG